MCAYAGNYRYDPEVFDGILNLASDLQYFYCFIEKYNADPSKDNWYELLKHWEDLFFTIKHREVEGFLNPSTANELRGYLEELVNG